MSKPEDLIKVLALGMITEFSGVMYRPRYRKRPEYEVVPKERTFFRLLMKTFTFNYATCLDGEWVHPSYIFQLSKIGRAHV